MSEEAAFWTVEYGEDAGESFATMLGMLSGWAVTITDGEGTEHTGVCAGASNVWGRSSYGDMLLRPYIAGKVAEPGAIITIPDVRKVRVL